MVALTGVECGFCKSSQVSQPVVVLPSAKYQVALGALTPETPVAALPGKRYIARSTTMGRGLSTRLEKAAFGRT